MRREGCDKTLLSGELEMRTGRSLGRRLETKKTNPVHLSPLGGCSSRLHITCRKNIIAGPLRAMLPVLQIFSHVAFNVTFLPYSASAAYVNAIEPASAANQTAS